LKEEEIGNKLLSHEIYIELTDPFLIKFRVLRFNVCLWSLWKREKEKKKKKKRKTNHKSKSFKKSRKM